MFTLLDLTNNPTTTTITIKTNAFIKDNRLRRGEKILIPYPYYRHAKVYILSFLHWCSGLSIYYPVNIRVVRLLLFCFFLFFVNLVLCSEQRKKKKQSKLMVFSDDFSQMNTFLSLIKFLQYPFSACYGFENSIRRRIWEEKKDIQAI